jgi:beta-N-acetylhexosaminidase
MMRSTPSMFGSVRFGKYSLHLAVISVALVLLASSGASGLVKPAKGGSANADHLQSKIRDMTLEEKVGQMFMLQVYGQSVNDRDPAIVEGNRNLYGVDTIEEVIDKYKPGGIAYFAGPSSQGIPDNVDDPRQIAGLSNGIQRAATQQPAGLPMLISTDQEQGVVVRVTEPATQFPGNMALSATRNTEYAKQAAQITGEELRALGINQNFAPVADVNVNPQNPVIGVRSFGSSPDLVATMTSAQVGGYQKNVAPTAKHFPGHGDTDTDSHTGLPKIDHSLEEIEKVDLPPFRSAIKSGVDTVMSAHIVVPALDSSGRPATLSKPILTDVLRKELGYKGVIITDALTMDALKQFGEEKVPVAAIEAGVDVLLMPKKMDVAYNAVLEAVKNGRIPEKRIDESVKRILKLKQKRGLFKNPYVDEGEIDGVVGTPQHLSTAQAIADKSVTLVKNESGTLPLQENSGEKALVTGYGATGFGLNAVENLARAIEERGLATEAFQTGINPNEAQIDAAVLKARESDLVIVTTGKAWDPNRKGQQELVKRLLGTGKPIVVAAVYDPYDIAHFPEAETYVATYGFRAVSMEALSRVLFGEVNPSGKLPVSIPVAGNPNETLYPYGHAVSY